MNNKFSENLKKIRKDNNLSQEQLADELGVSRQAISKWESAVAYPEMDKIITLCEKFNLNIDDLLHKDIREIKGEEESKKNLNKFIDDFLNFITNTINMFSNMNLKSKIKCLFEQCVIGFILFVIFCIVGIIVRDLLSGVFGIIPDKYRLVMHEGTSKLEFSAVYEGTGDNNVFILAQPSGSISGVDLQGTDYVQDFQIYNCDAVLANENGIARLIWVHKKPPQHSP